MSRTYNEYYFEKEDVMKALDDIGLLSGLLRIVYAEQGLDTIEYLVNKKANRKFNWFNDYMMRDIINTWRINNMDRTKTYVMSVEKNSPAVLEQLNKLQEVRQSVRLLNRHSKSKHYVKCQGRWGRNNPDYNQRTIPFCPLDKAVKWDVYIYEK